MSFRWRAAVSAIVISVHLCVVLSAAAVYLLWNNNLNQDGNWKVSKRELEMPAMGEQTYCETPQALARGHLNLGAWHGFQEVIYKRPVNIRDLEFRFLLGANAYLSLIDHRDQQEFRGFRFSANSKFANIAFTAANEGEFLQTTPIPLALLETGRWYRCCLRVADQTPFLTLDDRPVSLGDVPPAAFTTLGFRGCDTMVLVDDVKALEEDGTVIHDTFINTRHWLPVTLAALAIVSAFDLLVLLLMKRAKFPPMHMAFGLIYLGGVAVIVLGTAFCFIFLTQQRYPTEGAIPKHEVDRAQNYCLKQVHKRVEGCAPEPPAGVVRIVFLGTSQTFGAGASKSSDALVPRVRKLLNAAAPSGISYECINAGIGGGDSSLLADLYRDVLLPLHPQLLVIDLATNDRSGPRLAANLN